MDSNIENNPLLTPSTHPFGAPSFGEIALDDYLPAFKEAIERARKEIDEIVACPEAPTFENTIIPLEYSGMLLGDVEGIFFNLLEADSSERMEAISEEVSPLLTSFGLYMTLSRPLFERIRTIYREVFGSLDPRAEVPSQYPGLEPRDIKLLRDTYRSFYMGGANLEGEDRTEFEELSKELSLLGLKFSSNVLAATNAFSLDVLDKEDLEGLPEYVLDEARETASRKGLSGWSFTLHLPSFGPFMKFSRRRDLRRRMWMAYNSRCLGGKWDNTSIIERMVSLRRRKALMLGFDTYADLALEGRMAKDRAGVEELLSSLMGPSLPVARRELAELLSFARERGFESDILQPWDFPFWAERYKEEKFSLGESLLKPYFRLENCIEAVFGLATSLYGITFTERRDIPVYHPDVKVYEVKDENGEHLSLFYADFFPRPSKQGGAWMTEFRGQYSRGGEDMRPFISIVTNFSKPGPSTPSLLTHDELTTFLHEFGHSLHGMLSRGRYPSQCGTSVERDFVELPSQLMENWAFEREFLDSFAHHYKTGDPIPEDYLRRIVESRNFLSAYYQVRQLHFGILDMAWHTLPFDSGEGVEAFEKRILSPYVTLPPVEGTCTSTSFGHIFSGGYSAGYYSYKWAEVLEADAFSLFQKEGIFSRKVASSFRKNILEKGSSEPAEVLYRRFRGKDPRPEALLRKLGIVS